MGGLAVVVLFGRAPPAAGMVVVNGVRGRGGRDAACVVVRRWVLGVAWPGQGAGDSDWSGVQNGGSSENPSPPGVSDAPRSAPAGRPPPPPDPDPPPPPAGPDWPPPKPLR